MKRTVLALIGLALLAGCGGGGGDSPRPPAPVTMTSLTVFPSSQTLKVGETKQYTVTDKEIAQPARATKRPETPRRRPKLSYELPRKTVGQWHLAREVPGGGSRQKQATSERRTRILVRQAGVSV